MGHCIFSQTPTLKKVAAFEVFPRIQYIQSKVNFRQNDTCILLDETELDIRKLDEVG